jgi:hypothetical protein
MLVARAALREHITHKDQHAASKLILIYDSLRIANPIG